MSDIIKIYKRLAERDNIEAVAMKNMLLNKLKISVALKV